MGAARSLPLTFKTGTRMLVLSRKVGESFVIGEKITVTVVRIAHNTVRLGVEAPPGCEVVRQELMDLLSKAQPGDSSEAEPAP